MAFNVEAELDQVVDEMCREAWSDAARAASAAARRARKKGTKWRPAARKAFKDAAIKSRYSSTGYMVTAGQALRSAPVTGMTKGQWKQFKRKTDRYNRLARA